MSDPILDALNAAAQRGNAAPVPGQPMSAPGGTADPVLAALQLRAGQTDPTPTPPAPPRSVLEQTGDFLSAGVHHAANLPWATGQLMANGLAKLFSLTGDNAISRTVTSIADDANHTVSDREAKYQASTPNSTGAYAGATLGSIAPLMVGGLGGGVQGAGEAVASRAAPYLPKAIAPLGAKAISGATQGAIMGAAQPVASRPLTLADLVAPQSPEPGFWEQKADQVGMGAAFGGALPVVAAPIGAVWNAGKRVVANSPIINPSTYAARQVGIQLGADAPTVASDLVNAPQLVPGSVPTSAQAGADPRLVMMEKGLANQNPTFKAALAARENANNAARLEAVGNVAKTPQALEEAIAQRAAVTGPMRDFTVTNGRPVPVGPIDSALASLQNGSLGVRPTIGGAAGSMRSALEDMTTSTPADTLSNTPGSSVASPAMLDALRQNANDYLSKFSPQGFVGTQEQAAMTPVKSAIVDAIDAANPGHKLSTGGWGQGMAQHGPVAPGYRDYLAEFAKRSVPINTMEVGQNLQRRMLDKAFNSAGEPAATLPNYRSALAAALRDAPYGIDPAAQAALEGVQSDLQRATISNSLRTSGSDTAYNQGAGQTFLDALGVGKGGGNGKAAVVGLGTLATTGNPFTASGAMNAVKSAGSWTTNRVGNALGDLLLDPQKLAEALTLSMQPPAAAAPSAFSRAVLQLPAAKAALIGELLRAQAPQVVGPDAEKAHAYQP